MAPVGRVAETEYQSEEQEISTAKYAKDYKLKIVWKNVVILSALHFGALIGAYHMVTDAKYQTVIAWFVFYISSGMGITAGAHRLWSHRSYKANFKLRVILCYLQTMAAVTDLYEWCRDHRVHHKYSETDADPHNATRGFFFSHVGWLFCKKHPEVLEKGKTIDLSDLLDDPIVRFQRKHYRILILISAFLVPMFIPYLLWSETLFNSFYICVLYRYCYTLNCTWLVNSAAHLYGNTPYDKSINPTENTLVTVGSMGEGYHNYHHTFPWDYSASELDWKYNLNFSTFLIDCFAKIGWAYDRKKVKQDVVYARVNRTGDKDLLIDITKLNLIKLLTMKVFGVTIGMSHLWIPFLIRFIIIK